MPKLLRQALPCLGLALTVGLAACGGRGIQSGSRERECMARAMYFESNRSSDEGMLAVGTVVMNRVNSGQFPKTVCGVVGQKNQFAPGVLSKPMTDSGRERAYRMADEVLRGKRHRRVGKAMFFHTAGHRFPYRNMHYVLVAGGNAFYDKRKGTVNDPRRQDVLIAEAARREPAATRSAEIQIAGTPIPAVHRLPPRAAGVPMARPAAPDWAAPPPFAVAAAYPAAPVYAAPVYPAAPAMPQSIEDLILTAQ